MSERHREPETRLQTIERWRSVITDADDGLAFEAGRLDGCVHASDLRRAVKLLDEHPGLFWQEHNAELASTRTALELANASSEELLAQRDAARSALRALVDALYMDDRPRLAAIELARRMCERWEART